jgi:hypothetical protein
MEERRRKGLCYSCDAKWTRGHVCQVPKLFLIEVADQEEEEGGKTASQAEEDPGEFFLEKFREIVGIIWFRKAIILIDSGSTHNFVDVKLAAALGIQPIGQDGIKVKIANGQEVASLGKSREVEVKMQGYIFRTEFVILPLAGCDAILGIQWLRTLGPILWDFTQLEMRFRYEGTGCTLCGLRQGSRMSWEEGDSFKLSKLERKGILLYLME